MDDLVKQASETPEAIDTMDRATTTTLRDALAAQVKDIAAGIDESADVDGDMAALEEAKDRHDRTLARLAALDTADAERAEKVAKLTEGIVEDVTTDPDEDEDDSPEEAPAEIVVEVVEELEAVAASAKPSIGNLAKRTPKAHKPAETPTTLTASAALGGGQLGSPMDVAKIMGRMAKNGDRPARGRSLVAAAQLETHRDDRYTVSSDVEKNTGVFAQVAKDAQAEAKRVANGGNALTAAGGFCAPAQPVYELFAVGGNGGGISLPVVNAPRGRIIYVASPTYEDFRTNPAWWNAAGDDYTAAEDAADTEKNVFVIECPDTVTCEVVAHPAITQASNFQGRFYPEFITRVMDVTMMGHFHRVNSFLINAMVNNSVDHNVTNVQGGSYTQFFQALQFHTALLRETYRLDIGATLELALPHWTINALAADIVARDATLDFNVTRARVMSDINSMNVRVQEVYDWQGQNISGDQPGTTAQGNFPATVDVLLWIPGAVVRLDGGTLNLGEVRDSTLNNTNNYQTFVETWEQVCFPGPLPWLLDNISICPTGGTGARVTITCATGS
jgi:hypothetical protein